MRLNKNLMSLGIYKNYTNKISTQSKALNNITTGYKINSAKDNANAIGKSEQFRMQIRGLDMAQRNLQDCAGMLQTADGGLDGITSALNRMKELTIQSGGATTETDKKVIQEEIESLKNHIDTTAKNTEFNGVKLLYNPKVTDNENPVYLQNASGANVGEKTAIPMYNLSINNLATPEGKALKNIDITQDNGVNEDLSTIDDVLDQVLSVRSKYGAIQNKLESLKDALGETSVSLAAAESSVRDADLAEEIMTYASNGILIDSAIAMMAQSNKFPQDVLRILERMN